MGLLKHTCNSPGDKTGDRQAAQFPAATGPLPLLLLDKIVPDHVADHHVCVLDAARGSLGLSYFDFFV